MVCHADPVTLGQNRKNGNLVPNSVVLFGLKLKVKVNMKTLLSTPYPNPLRLSLTWSCLAKKLPCSCKYTLYSIAIGAAHWCMLHSENFRSRLDGIFPPREVFVLIVVAPLEHRCVPKGPLKKFLVALLVLEHSRVPKGQGRDSKKFLLAGPYTYSYGTYLCTRRVIKKLLLYFY